MEKQHEQSADTLSDTGVIKLQRALDGVNQRIVAHFTTFVVPVREPKELPL